MQEKQTDQDQNQTGKLSLWQLVVSVLGAAFGVQSGKTQRRDFQQKSPWVFIFAGIVFGIGFVLTLVIIVKMVLATTG